MCEEEREKSNRTGRLIALSLKNIVRIAVFCAVSFLQKGTVLDHFCRPRKSLFFTSDYVPSNIYNRSFSGFVYSTPNILSFTFNINVWHVIKFQFPPEFDTGDAHKVKMRLPNHVYNKLKIHSMKENKRANKLHEKKEHSTAVRNSLYLISQKILIEMNDRISKSGKVERRSPRRSW